MPDINESEIVDPFQRPVPSDSGNQKGYLPVQSSPPPFDEPTPESGYVPTQLPPVVVIVDIPPSPPTQEPQSDD